MPNAIRVCASRLHRHCLTVGAASSTRVTSSRISRAIRCSYFSMPTFVLRRMLWSAWLIMWRRATRILFSGVPRQKLETFSDHLLLPLIHFVLLGFLPLAIMRRRDSSPACSAGCGQLIVTRRDAYFASGGHAGFRAEMHDGLKLPRAFRGAGFRTDLFDATDLATCRMYRTNAEVWRGLSKNATEGLGAPKAILPMSFVLFGGQVLPFLLLAFADSIPPLALVVSGAAAVLVLLPRFVSIPRFKQSVFSALLHPLGVVALIGIQWHAFFRSLLGKPAEWRGRRYAVANVNAA